jgi:L,D-peptidoglycan transpeptidase YkuD (ErfK/YbiS/YcfS/YnhG family)
LWSDDVKDAAYNQLVRAPYAPSHENLRRADPLYDLVLLTDWNWPNAEPGRGSAIFLHRWRRPGFPTEGCVAFRPDHLRQVVRKAAPGTRLIVSANLHGRGNI